MSGTARPSATICATWLFGASRSPNRIAPPMHETEHIGVASAPPPGGGPPAPRAAPGAPGAPGGRLGGRGGVEVAARPREQVPRAVGAGHGAGAAADAERVLHVDDAVLALAGGAPRAR